MAKASTTQGAPAVPAQPAESVASEPLAGATELESFMAGHLEATFDSATPPPKEKPAPATGRKPGPEEQEPTAESGDEPDTDTDDEADDGAAVSLSDLLEDDGEGEGTDDDETGDDDGEGEGEPKDKADTPEWVQKRLSKMSEQKREWKAKAEQAEAKAKALEADLESARAGKITLPPTADNPLADVLDEKTLGEKLATARAALDWLDENPDGGTVELGEGKEMELSAAEVAKRKRYFERLINEHAPARKAWIANREAATAEAKKHYPSIYQEGSRLAKVREGILSNIPGLAARHDADVFVGDAFVGALVRTGQLKVFKNDAKKQTPPPAPKPSTPAKPAAHSAPVSGPATAKARQAEALLQRAAKTGKRADLAGALEVMLD